MTKENIPVESIAYFIPEFCKKFAISKSSFYREVRTKRLQIYKRGKRTMIEKTEAERWYANLPRELQQNTIPYRVPQIGGSVLTAP